MPASDKTRRALFALGGGRCAMCRRSLLIEDPPGGKRSHIAEAAHIIGEQESAARGKDSRPGDINGLDNLILLCPSDHTLIDKRADLWPAGKLRNLKRDHEAWMAVMAARPSEDRPVPVYKAAALPDIGPDGIVTVDGVTYRLAVDRGVGDHSGALGHCERWLGESDAVMWQAFASRVGTPSGHVWLRRLEVARETAVTEQWRTAIADEAAQLAALPRVDGLPRLCGIEMAPRCAGVVTESTGTVTLDVFFSAERMRTQEEIILCCEKLTGVCTALSVLHASGRAHGALDRDTILFPRRGGAALRDLGLSGRPREEGDEARRADGDLRALAGIVYEFVTGRRPRRGRQIAPSVLNPAFPATADAILIRALAADPDDGDIRRFGRALAEAVRAPVRQRS